MDEKRQKMSTIPMMIGECWDFVGVRVHYGLLLVVMGRVGWVGFKYVGEVDVVRFEL